MSKIFDRLVLAAAIAAVIVIAIIALVPGPLRPHTGASGQSEHLAAYVVTAFLFALRVRDRRQAGLLAALLCAYAGGLELLQLLVPERNAQLIDFVASTLGVVSGAVFGLMLSPVYRWCLKIRAAD
jgi:hypothetical protein